MKLPISAFGILVLALTGLAPSQSAFGQKLSAGGDRCADSRIVYQRLQSLATQTSASTYGVAQKRITITTKAISFNLDPAPYSFISSNPDRMTVPLELLIRVAVLRRDLDGLSPKQTFQIEPLRSLYNIARALVDAGCNSATESDWQATRQRLQAEAKKALLVVARGLETYAQAKGLDVVQERGPAEGFMIKIAKNPPDARLRIMQQLDWDLCHLPELVATHYRSSVEECLNDKSRTPGSPERLIGKIHYLLELQSGTHRQIVDGTFLADMDKAISLP